jgi:hypothetical protein
LRLERRPGFREQLQRDAAHDDAIRRDVRDAIEVWQPHARDDAAREWSLFHEQHLRSCASRGESSRTPSAATAADENVSFNHAQGPGHRPGLGGGEGSGRGRSRSRLDKSTTGLRCWGIHGVGGKDWKKGR